MLGVLGFFYEPSFGHGRDLVSDDLQGLFQVNGWQDALWLVTGLVGLGVASRAARVYALAAGIAYAVLGIWGLAVVDRGFGTIADLVPLDGWNNALHLILGATGIAAGIVSGPLPSVPRRLRRRPPARRARASTVDGAQDRR
jgi:hypothetical protein